MEKIKNIKLPNGEVYELGGSGASYIGQIISMNCTANYVPEGSLPCDGAEYTKTQFTGLWENYLTGGTYYAYYADTMYAGETATLYTASPNPADGDTVYELIDGEMMETSYVVTYVSVEAITFQYAFDVVAGHDYLIGTAYRDTTKDIINSLLNTCTYEEYEQELATYGQCAKFAIDIDNETFRVPTIKDGAVIQQAMSDSELGKAYNAGLPNITASLGDIQGGKSVSATGAIQIEDTSSNNSTGSNAATYNWFGFDASRSNSIYGNSDTVQMNAVALRYFVVVANGQINESMMDWSAWASSLQGKVSYSDLEEVDVVTVPDYTTGVSITSGWVAPYDGIGFCESKRSDDNSCHVYVDGVVVYSQSGGDYPKNSGVQWFVPKGGIVTFDGTYSISPIVYKMRGVK